MFQNYRVTINGTDVSNLIKTGIVLNEKLDEELDSGTLVLNNSLLSDPYQRFSKVFIELIGHEIPITFVVLKDDVAREANDKNLYRHTIALIEPTKYAEKIMLPDLTFRQPPRNEWERYTVISALERLRENSPIDLGYNDKYFDIDNSLQDLTQVIPEITLNQNNLREALNKVLSTINLIPRFYLSAAGRYVLTADEVNALKTKIDPNAAEVFEYRKTGDGDYYGGALETRLENATQKYATIKYPSVGWASVTTEDKGAFNTDNLTLELPFPIYEIKKLEIWCKTSVNGETRTKARDVTAFTFPKEKWDLLPDTFEENYKTEYTKGGTFYYDVGDNKIKNILKLYSRKNWIDNIFGSEFTTLAFIVARTDNADVTNVNILSSTNFEIYFRVEAVAALSSTIKNYREQQMDGEVFNNQSENIVDLLDFGNSAWGTINKIGNDELYVSKLSRGGTEYKCGDYTADGYIVSAVTNQYQKGGFVISAAALTKNFNQISKYIGVDSSIRQIPIPWQQPTARLHYDDFCIVDNAVVTGDTYKLCVTNEFLTLFADYLKGEY